MRISRCSKGNSKKERRLFTREIGLGGTDSVKNNLDGRRPKGKVIEASMTGSRRRLDAV